MSELPSGVVVDAARGVIDDFRPDVVVTFGPDGGFGHPDHVTSCDAVVEAVRAAAGRPRLLHAAFPAREELLLDVLVDWLRSQPGRFVGTPAFGHALKLFADGSSMLGFAADHLRVEWFPAGSYLIEQGEPAFELFCILSGSADVVVELEDGRLWRKDMVGAGCFVGDDGIAAGATRNAHVIARDAVTCLVLAPRRRSQSAGRGAGASVADPDAEPVAPAVAPVVAPDLSVDVRSVLDRKVAALAAHRTQYALQPDLLPPSMVERLLGIEHFVDVDP
jgi:LmbE family N-acetylglucosaminyl deacetylase